MKFLKEQVPGYSKWQEKFGDWKGAVSNNDQILQTDSLRASMYFLWLTFNSDRLVKIQMIVKM
jgi:hypothetical protein